QQSAQSHSANTSNSIQQITTSLSPYKTPFMGKTSIHMTVLDIINSVTLYYDESTHLSSINDTIHSVIQDHTLCYHFLQQIDIINQLYPSIPYYKTNSKHQEQEQQQYTNSL